MNINEKFDAQNMRALTPAQRRLIKQQLKLKSIELRVELDSVRRQLEAMRRAEDMPGHIAVREWVAQTGINLSHSDLTRLCKRMSTRARRGEITSGEKSVETNTSSRNMRAATYEPEIIAATHAELFKTPRVG